MSLHRRGGRDSLDADIYGTQAADVSVPKYQLAQRELPPDVAHALVRDELLLDGNARQNLATFCQTWLDTEVHDLMDLSLDKNMIDKDEYPATAEIESRCVHILANLWHSPKAADTVGCSTTGSSEACMLGGLALKWKWREGHACSREAYRQPQPDHGTGSGLLAQICPIFRRGAAGNSARAWTPRHDAGGGSERLRLRTRSA